MSKNPTKFSRLIITPYLDRKCEPKQEIKISRDFMKDEITRNIRENRYYDTVETLSATAKRGPLCLGSQTYNELFKKLVEFNQRFFTEEYGKNADDYKRFVENCTKIYEIPKRLDNSLVFDRMRFFKFEKESMMKKKMSTVSSKKSKSSFFFRHKGKSESRYRLKSTSKRSTKSIFRKTKKLRRIDAFGGVMFERSLSDLVDSSSEEGPLPGTTPKDLYKKVKPFVFKLSDPEMIKKGITVNYQLPLRFITFHAEPTNDFTFWFQHRSKPLKTHYPNGQLCLFYDVVGSGALFYNNGDRAISFEYGRIGPLIIVYSKSKQIRTKTIKPVPAAVFDLRGNGIVYDTQTGKKRLVYDQAQGILLDSPSGYPLPWKWNSYSRVTCRRAELQFLPPHTLKDIEYDKNKALRDARESYLLRKMRNKRFSPLTKRGTGSKLKAKTKKAVKAEYVKMLQKINKRHAPWETDLTLKPRKRNIILRELSVQKILKFVGSSYIIKPALTPCLDMDNVARVNFSRMKAPSRFSVGSSKKPGSKLLSSDSSRTKFGRLRSRMTRTQSDLLKEPLTRCKHKLRRRYQLKPIILKLTENISLTITDQEHIHIDFISHPMHYIFCIGVKIFVERTESIYEVRCPELDKDCIPSSLEALKYKCPSLYNINCSITNLRNKALKRSRMDYVKKLKSWGQDKYLGKVPLCKLMNNKCNCRVCNCILDNLK